MPPNFCSYFVLYFWILVSDPKLYCTANYSSKWLQPVATCISFFAASTVWPNMDFGGKRIQEWNNQVKTIYCLLGALEGNWGEPTNRRLLFPCISKHRNNFQKIQNSLIGSFPYSLRLYEHKHKVNYVLNASWSNHLDSERNGNHSKQENTSTFFFFLSVPPITNCYLFAFPSLWIFCHLRKCIWWVLETS